MRTAKRLNVGLTLNLYTVPLGRCDIDWHADRGIVAVACVGPRQVQAVAAAGGDAVV